MSSYRSDSIILLFIISIIVGVMVAFALALGVIHLMTLNGGSLLNSYYIPIL